MDIVKDLVKAGVDFYKQDSEGNSPEKLARDELAKGIIIKPQVQQYLEKIIKFLEAKRLGKNPEEELKPEDTAKIKLRQGLNPENILIEFEQVKINSMDSKGTSDSCAALAYEHALKLIGIEQPADGKTMRERIVNVLISTLDSTNPKDAGIINNIINLFSQEIYVEDVQRVEDTRRKLIQETISEIKLKTEYEIICKKIDKPIPKINTLPVLNGFLEQAKKLIKK